jgi:aminoglycoside phosphotransferase family enzyme
MVAVINPYRASFRRLMPLSQELSFYKPQQFHSKYSSIRHYYKIEYIRKSENAWLLFVCHKATGEHIVLKILCKYKDTRYSLEAVIERQKCQLEALQWNRVFTPEVYVGLARICDFDLNQVIIVIDDVIEDSNETLDQCSEYALVMRQLPMEWRLDLLLNRENIFSLSHYIKLLTKSLMQIHQKINPLSLEEARKWGEFLQLKRKLEHNFALADPLLKAIENGQNSSYKLVENTVHSLKDTFFKVLPQGQNHRSYYRLKENFIWLKNNLLQAIIEGPFQEYFEQRVQGQYIKRCHGDLKAPNIWIAPYESSSDTEPEKFVRILDAIDFNPSYCNIDILSDFAMLVIDIQVRTKSSLFADLMVEEYLEITGQDDKIARLVLSYYLVEKAYVGAAISFVYDNAPKLGWAFLKVAETRMNDLKCQLSMRNHLPTIETPKSSSIPSVPMVDAIFAQEPLPINTK